MTEKILFVDDDTNILSGFQRYLRKQYSVDIAPGGAAGIKAIQSQGPYAVVVSDMRMPEIDGVQFLSQVRAQSPDTVRIMLTGQADMQDAINAVNEGNIFRFLTKPCDTELLTKTLDAALTQFRLITAERELLEKTLNGSIKLLTDVLSLVNPDAFSRAERIKRIVQHICSTLNISDIWQFEVASLLSQLGCVTLPKDILKKYNEGLPLTNEEKDLLETAPLIGHDLLINIPRLESIAKMVAWQQKPFKNFSSPQDLKARKPVELGAQLLTIAVKYDDLVTRQKQSVSHAVSTLLENPDTYDPQLVECLKTLGTQEKEMVKQEVDIFDLTVDMIIAENISTNKGVFLVAAGQEVNTTLIKFLQNYVNRGEINDRISVLVRR